MSADEASWRRDAHLSGKLHPDFPDDIRVLLHDGGPLFCSFPPEVVWARLVSRVDDGVYRAILLNQPFQLTNRTVGDLIHVAVAGGDHPLVYVTDRYLIERASWSVNPCNQCALSVLFDAPSDLIAATFADLPSDVSLTHFTATCPLCGGKLIIASTTQPEP
jgi:hypothetical protein